MRAKILAGASVAAISVLWFSPALADSLSTVTGYVDGGYNYTNAGGGSGHLDNWNIEGAVAAPLGSNIAVQGNLGYDQTSASGGGGTLNNTKVGATLFGGNMSGRIGANVSYSNLSGSGSSSIGVTSYGVFGDWYVSDVLTLSARGGGLSGSGLSLNKDNYLGAQITGYICPNLAITGTATNLHLDVITESTYGVGLEYLFKEAPVSVAVGYTDINLSAGPTIVLNTYSVALKYYFGGGSLRDHQRSGAETYGATSPLAGFFLF